MDRDRKEPRRHPSTLIAGALIEEINSACVGGPGANRPATEGNYIDDYLGR